MSELVVVDVVIDLAPPVNDDDIIDFPEETRESMESGRNIYIIAVKKAPIQKSLNIERKRISSFESFELYC